MKRITIIVVLLLLLTCCNSNRSYTFSQPFENIESIEIIYVDPFSSLMDYDQVDAIATIHSDRWDEFIRAFSEIPCSSYFLDPPHAIEGDVIRITYMDGGYEVICEIGCLHIASNGDWRYPPNYFDSEAFNSLTDAAIEGKYEKSK